MIGSSIRLRGSGTVSPSSPRAAGRHQTTIGGLLTLEPETAVEAAQDSGALLSRPRLWVDLLSSQPLCFNLFGPFAEDPDVATAVLQLLWPHIVQVTEIKFEWSPGRDDTPLHRQLHRTLLS